MSSNIEVEPKPGGEVRPSATAHAGSQQPVRGTCDLVHGKSYAAARPQGAERFSVDPMCETDRYRLVQSMPLPQ